MRRVVAALLGLVAVAACDVSDRPRDPHRLTIGIANEVTTLDPATTLLMAGYSVWELTYERLLRFTVRDGRTVGIEGELATAWSSSPDGLVWTFTLAPGHRFDDGSEVTAEAVKFTFDRVKVIGQGPGQSFFWLKAIETPDPHTVRFLLKSPAPFLLDLLALPPAGIVNPAILQHREGNDQGSAWLAEHSAGSGPYRVTRFARRDTVELQPNPYAAAPPAYFTTVAIRTLLDETAAAIQLAKGDVDVLDPLALHLREWVTRHGPVRTFSGPSGAIAFLNLNTERKPFDDPRVREAVALALDRDLLIGSVLKGAGRRLVGSVPEGVPGYDPAIPPLAYDPDRARALLAEAGVAPGTPVTLTVVGDSGNPPATTVAIREQLQAVGFAVKIEQIAASARSRLFKGDYDLSVQTISLDFPDPWIVFNFLYYSPMIGAANMPRYRSPEVDRIVAAADAAGPDERAAMFREANRIVSRDLPAIPLYQLDRTIVAGRDLEGLTYNFAQPFVIPAGSMRRMETP